MRFRNTLIALVLLFVIGGYAFVVRFYSKPMPVEVHTALKVKPEEIAKIELKYPDRALTLERKPGAPWMITTPLSTKADQGAANNLAREIANCRITKTVEEHAADLAPFGLARPHVIVTVTTTDNRTLPGIEVGKKTPVGFSAYIKLATEPAVMLTVSTFEAGMKKTVDQMRDHDLIALKADEVKRFTIERANGPTIEVERDNKQWTIVKPVRYPADSTEVHKLLRTLSEGKIADFISETPADVGQYGLDKPHLTVTVYPAKADGGPQSLLFGSKQKGSDKGRIYLRRGEHAPVCTVGPWVLSSVDKSLLELRDKTVLGLEPSKVETVEGRSNGKEFTLKRAAGGKWDLVEDGKTSQADAAAVGVFLDAMHGLKGNSIVMDPLKNPEAFGMDKPALMFKFAGKDGKSLGELKVSKVEKKSGSPGERQASAEYYVSSSGSALFSTEQVVFDELGKSPGRFRPRSQPAASASPSPSAR